jgi:hypothetical protein
MPYRVKFILSLVWLVAAAGGYLFIAHLGETVPSYADIFLGFFAVIAMWIFPEVAKKDLTGRNGR